jgi:hypothetical protein
MGLGINREFILFLCNPNILFLTMGKKMRPVMKKRSSINARMSPAGIFTDILLVVRTRNVYGFNSQLQRIWGLFGCHIFIHSPKRHRQHAV